MDKEISNYKAVLLKYVQGVNIFFIINKLYEKRKKKKNKNKIQLHIFLIYEIPHRKIRTKTTKKNTNKHHSFFSEFIVKILMYIF